MTEPDMSFYEARRRLLDEEGIEEGVRERAAAPLSMEGTTADPATVPVCWRCKKSPGAVSDGTANECVSCAGETMRLTRQMLNDINDAAREGLSAWPRCMDRVEFVRECIKLHRRAASDQGER